MIKYVYCIRKRADLTDEEFHTYWKENHATFIRGLAKTLKAKKYIQSHKLDTPLNDEFVKARGFDSPAYDGVTELWWDNLDDFLASFSTPEGIEATKQYVADEANFVDFSQSRAFLTEEHVVFDFTSEPT
jgi:uncharacterized protein (TIGR02118 family)